MTTNRKADEADIRRIIHARMAGLRTKNVDAVMAQPRRTFYPSTSHHRSPRAGRTAIGKT